MRLYSAEKPWGDVLPRYAFLEQVFLEKKVLEIGCGDGSGVFFLKNRGARQVVGTDLEGADFKAAQRRRKMRGVSFKPFDGQRLGFTKASFDVVIDFRLSASVGAGFLDEIRRVLKPDGFLVTMFRSPEHLSFADLSMAEDEVQISYEDFLSSLQDNFSQVTVIGQTPFVGFSVGGQATEEEELPLEMDSVLLPEEGEEVAFYLMVCGPDTLSFESQSLVQLSYRTLVQEVSDLAASAPAEEELEAKENALRESQEQVARLQAENQQLARSGEEMGRRLAAMEGASELGRKRAEELQELSRRYQDEMAEKLSWLEASRSEAEDLRHQIQAFQKKFSAQKQRIEELEQEILNRSRVRSDSDVLVGSLKEENAGLRISLKQLNDEVAGLRREKLRWDEERERMEQEQQQRQALVVELRQKVDFLSQQSGRLEQQHREVQEQRSTLEQELSDLQAANENLQDQEREARAEAEKLGQMFQQTRKREQALSAEREALQGELAARQGELLQVRRQLTEETARIAQMEAKLSDQAERTQVLEADLVALVNRMEDGQYRDYDRQKMAEELQKRINSQHAALDGAREKVDELTKDLYTSRKHEEELSASLEANRGLLVKQEKACEAAELRLADLQMDSADRLRGLEARLQKAESRLAATQRELTRRTEDLQRSEGAIETLNREAGHLTKELQRAKDHLEVAEGRLLESTDTSARVKTVEQELAWHREEVDRLSTALQTREEELEEVRWELEHIHSELDNSREEFERVGRESAEALAAKAALEQQAEQMRTKNQELEDQVQQAEEQRVLLEKLQQEMEETRKALEREKSHSSLMSEELERLRLELKPTREEHERVLEREQTLQARVATLQQQLGELEEKTGNELGSLSDQLRRREEQMQSMTEHLAKMEEDARAADARAGRLQRELDEERKKIEADRFEQLARVEASLASSQRRIQELEQALAEREGQIGELRRKLAAQSQSVTPLTPKVPDPGSKPTEQ